MNGPKNIYLDDPNIGALEKQYLNRCIDSTYVSTYGPFVPEFEERFSQFLQTEKSVALQSGTAGLHVALHELGIGTGDEVIVPVLTFIATANAVKYVGAKPVFVDVDPITWTMDPDCLRRAITDKTRAIIPVHLYGNPCDMDSILEIARKEDLYVIEDATESLGSKYDRRYTGTLGDLGVFSFNGNKLITTGGGGMITGSDPNRLAHIKYLVNQARDAAQSYTHSELGFNYRMTNLEAAMGLAQMERLGEFIHKKKEFAEIYRRTFKSGKEMILQQGGPKSEVVWWLVSGRIPEGSGMTVSQIRSGLQRMSIPSREVFMPLVECQPYADVRPEQFPNAYRIFRSGMTLPGSTLNELEEIEFTAEALISLFRKERQEPEKTIHKRRALHQGNIRGGLI